MKGHSPVVEQEEAGGQGDGELQPPPVREGVGEAVEEQEPDGEGGLVEDPHRPAVLRAHHLCHCGRAQRHVSAMPAPHGRNHPRARCRTSAMVTPWRNLGHHRIPGIMPPNTAPAALFQHPDSSREENAAAGRALA